MKKLILSLLIMPFAIGVKTNDRLAAVVAPIDIRIGEWPILLERKIEHADTSYSLQFRDVKILTGVVMDTLSFPNTSQLKYFESALTVLKKGSNGDMARFNNYSIRRADKKYDGTWYLLETKWSLTDFKQTEADLMINTIRQLKF